MNRFQVAAASSVLVGVLLVAVMAMVPEVAARAILRGVTLFLTSSVILGYARFLNPVPFLVGDADSRHMIGAGMVFVKIAVFVSIARVAFIPETVISPAVVDGTCSMGTPCWAVVIAMQTFLYILAMQMLIIGPLVYSGLRGGERTWLKVATAIGAVIGVAGFAFSL